MEIDYYTMLKMVLRYCNQDFALHEVPIELKVIVKKMCEYANNTNNRNISSFSNEGYSETYSEKDMFAVFGGMLSTYKRLRTV